MVAWEKRTMTLREAFESLGSFRRTPPAHGYPANMMHLFAPVDRVHEALVSLCGSAQVSIAAAMYGCVLVEWSFLEHYLDEAWCVISQELAEAGEDTHGIKLAELQADLAAV